MGIEREVGVRKVSMDVAYILIVFLCCWNANIAKAEL